MIKTSIRFMFIHLNIQIPPMPLELIRGHFETQISPLGAASIISDITATGSISGARLCSREKFKFDELASARQRENGREQIKKHA
jgi:hypothetical protein